MKKMLLVLLLLALPVFGVEYEKQGWVNDYANILSENEKILLTNKLVKLHDLNGTNLIIVTTPSLENRPIEDWSVDLFLKWKVGKKGEDNGMVYVIAPNEHKWRIEVGYGLEGRFPDGKITTIGGLAKESFKKNNYYNGIDLVLEKIISDFTGDGNSVVVSPNKTSTEKIILWVIVILIVLVIILLLLAKFSDSGYSGSSGYYGSSYSSGDSYSGGSYSGSSYSGGDSSSSSDSGGDCGGGGGGGDW